MNVIAKPTEQELRDALQFLHQIGVLIETQEGTELNAALTPILELKVLSSP